MPKFKKRFSSPPSAVACVFGVGGGGWRLPRGNDCVSIILGHRPQVSLSPAAG